MNPNMQNIQRGDEVWYKGLQWTVRRVKADLAILYRDDDEGHREIEAELIHMSPYVPPNEREEPPDDDVFPDDDVIDVGEDWRK